MMDDLHPERRRFRPGDHHGEGTLLRLVPAGFFFRCFFHLDLCIGQTHFRGLLLDAFFRSGRHALPVVQRFPDGNAGYADRVGQILHGTFQHDIPSFRKNFSA